MNIDRQQRLVGIPAGRCCVYPGRVGNFTQAKRRELAAKGWALPDGSYPIETRTDLAHAVETVGLGNTSQPDIVAHIKKQAKRLGATASLPASWSIADFYPVEDLGDFALDLMDVEERAKAYASWGTIAERMAREDGLETIGTWGADLHGVGLAKPSAARLTDYWTHGEGGTEKVKWGVKGSMTRCIRHLTGKVREPGGLCADYHKIATGEWPTEHGKAGIPS